MIKTNKNSCFLTAQLLVYTNAKTARNCIIAFKPTENFIFIKYFLILRYAT